jgi:hypothetical protein
VWRRNLLTRTENIQVASQRTDTPEVVFLLWAKWTLVVNGNDHLTNFTGRKVATLITK